jgi:hypothetical protein
MDEVLVAASRAVPDIGYLERFVRDGSDSEVRASPRHVRFPPGSGPLFVPK